MGLECPCIQQRRAVTLMPPPWDGPLIAQFQSTDYEVRQFGSVMSGSDMKSGTNGRALVAVGPAPARTSSRPASRASSAFVTHLSDQYAPAQQRRASRLERHDHAARAYRQAHAILTETVPQRLAQRQLAIA